MRVTIRPYELADIPKHFEAVKESTAELMPWMGWCKGDYALEDSRTWIAAQEGMRMAGTIYDFAIVDADADAFLGGCGLNQMNVLHRFCNLGYWVRTSATRRGVASTAVGLVARFGFEVLKLHRLEIVVAAQNIASCRVAEKAGATREGVLRNRLFMHGVPHDAVMFSLVPR